MKRTQESDESDIMAGKMKKSLLHSSAIALALAGSAHAAAIHHYSFDTDGTDSVGGNTATATTTALTFGNAGGAFGGFMDDTSATAFADLTSDIVLLASTITDTDGWAVSFWLNNWNFNDTVMGNSDTPRSDSGLWTRDTTTDPRIQIRDIGGANITATGANVDPSDNWTHFVMQREADGFFTLYVDGTAYTDSGQGTQSADFTLNALGTAEAGHGSGFVGDMDEVWVFDAALTQSEVGNLITFNSLVPEPATSALLGLGGLLLAARRRIS